MNAETLHAVDALYLENFLQTLLYRALHAEGGLRECLKHAEALGGEVNLSSDCRTRYGEVAERLSTVVSALEDIAGDLYAGGDLASDGEPLVQWGLIETVPEYETSSVIERLNTVERELIASMNQVGQCLISKTEANLSWSSQARVKAYLKLRPIPERPCYKADSMLRFSASPPHRGVHFFADIRQDTEASRSEYPWLLDSEYSSLLLLPLFEDVEIEVDISGDVTSPTDIHNPWRLHADKLC